MHEIQHDDVQQSRMQQEEADRKPSIATAIPEVQQFENEGRRDHDLRPGGTADSETGEEDCQPSTAAVIADVQQFDNQGEGDRDLQPGGTAVLEIGQEDLHSVIFQHLSLPQQQCRTH